MVSMRSYTPFGTSAKPLGNSNNFKIIIFGVVPTKQNVNIRCPPFSGAMDMVAKIVSAGTSRDCRLISMESYPIMGEVGSMDDASDQGRSSFEA